MEISILFFLTSGLFLGWALGANHLGNVFGTAVGTRMVRFSTAAIICSIFVTLGAVISGTGPAETLGKLGTVNAPAGAFMAAFAAALAVYLMTKAGLPVSTTQAIVGAIIGWNLFSATTTDSGALTKIIVSWGAGPLLAAVFSAALLVMTTATLRWAKLHLLRVDSYTRTGLILAGAFGAYSLGANNIANVMGVFVPVSPFTDVTVLGVTLTSTQQLFLLGGIAISVGVFTYSRKVVDTVGSGLVTMSPVAAWVVVMAHSIVLILFSSKTLEAFLIGVGLPPLPLVPVSSSEVVVGAVLGVGLVKGGRNIRWSMLGRIGMGWIATPVIAGVLCFTGLFFLQNVFDQEVYAGGPGQPAAVAAEAPAVGGPLPALGTLGDKNLRLQLR